MEAGVRFTKKLNPTANQTNQSRQMMPWSGRSLGSLAKKAGTQWRNRSHFSESHHSRSKGERVTGEPSASVQDGSLLSLEEVAESNLVAARAGLAAAAQNISYAAMLQRQGDYDGVAIAGPGLGGARHS